MSTGFLTKANAAFVDELYEEALELYTKGIENGAGAVGYSSRAQTHLKMGNYVEAAQDAGKAIDMDSKSVTGYFRKGKALFYMEEFEEAKKCFISGAKFDTKRSANYELWIRKCETEIAEEEEENDDDDDVAFVTNQEIHVENKSPPSPPKEVSKSTETRPPPVKPKYRHQWYQTGTHSCISLFAKKLSVDRVVVEFTNNAITIQTLTENLTSVDFEFHTELNEDIIPSLSSYEVLPSKVEIKMKKAIDGRMWSELDRGKIENDTEPVIQYPTSSRRTVNWDKMESEVKNEEENEKEEGDAAVQKLFQKIYAEADDDTRRAMNKSFQESKGTCLSTDWSSVGSSPVNPASRD